MFKRRRRDEAEVELDEPGLDADDEAGVDDGEESAADADVDAEVTAEDAAAVVARERAALRADGPWDSSERGGSAPSDDADDDADDDDADDDGDESADEHGAGEHRVALDLGSLRIPAIEGLEIRVDIDKASSRPVAVNLVIGEGAMQVQAFAAPKTWGLWDDIRGEIADGLRTQGGSAEEVDGPFGPELRAVVPMTAPDGTTTKQPARFLGVDGPRWFLRGVLSGKAATDDASADQLLAAFRQVVVHRGGEAMAPREMLPMELPASAASAPVADAAPSSGRPPLEPFKRGPEITERR